MSEHVLSGDFVRTMRDMALEDSGGTIRIMTIGNTGGWRNFANTQGTVAMPEDLDGLKICRMIRADSKLSSVPIIFLTARNTVADVRQAMEWHAVSYLTKPASPDRVIQQIREVTAVR